MEQGGSHITGYANTVWSMSASDVGQPFVRDSVAQPLLSNAFQPAMNPTETGMAPDIYLQEAGDEASSDSMDFDSVSLKSGASEVSQGGRNDPVKLSGPIAFAGDSDADKIPIVKEGRAKCAHCGAIGVKHSFYTKERKYCSRGCAKAAALGAKSPLLGRHSSEKEMIKVPSKDMDPASIAVDAVAQVTMFYRNSQSKWSGASLPFEPPRITVLDESRVYNDDEYRTGPFTFDTEGSYDWADCIGDLDFRAAPVSCFKHAPLSNIWDKICLGMKVEVPCRAEELIGEEVDEQDERYWIATVIRIQGYMAMLRYIGMPDPPEDPSAQALGDFWMHLCSDEMKPVGWCAGQQKLLIPPPWIQHRVTDWKDYLVKKLTGARTLLKNFGDERRERTTSLFKPELRLEVVDREKISQMRVATVHDVFGGRLHLRYQGLGEEDPGTWAHETSPLIRPVGWALEHLHDMEVSREYLERVHRRSRDSRDAPPSYFTLETNGSLENEPPDGCRDFLPGDKLECVDPLNANVIGSATIERILPGRYLIIHMDWYLPEERARDAFCRHASSKYIFPCGFCRTNGIPLKPPVGHDEDAFTWEEYLVETGHQSAPIALFQRVRRQSAPIAQFERTAPHHGFERGMKLECVDATDPRLICAATVVDVVQRLLRIHFDGWDEEYDMWVDCESPDIFPLGFCTLIDYPLQSPREETETKRKRGGGRRGRRRKGAQSSRPAVVASSVPPLAALAPMFPQLAELRRSPQQQSDSKVGVLPSPPDTEPKTESDSAFKADDESDVKDESSSSSFSAGPDSARAAAGNLDLTAPLSWSVADVCLFLHMNDSAQFIPKFRQREIDGKKFVELKLPEVMDLTDGKMGPAAKISKLIGDLSYKLNPALTRSRQSNVSRNRL